MRRIFCFSFFLLSLSSCYFTKALKYKKYKLEKLSDFPAIQFEKSSTPFHFHQSSLPPGQKEALDSMLLGSNKYAFAIIRNDSILYEFYNHGIADTSILPSFSVAKSFVSTLVGIAFEEGKIKSLDEPITNYLPELINRDKRFSKITIQHVLDMRTGIKSSENYYNPMSDVLRLGFGKNIWKKTLKLSIEKEPNMEFEYRSVNTQLLAFIVERATGQKLQDYFNQKLYQPLQMERNGTWLIDDEKHKTLRAFCCMNLTLRDYAKFGKLFLDKGRFNGKQIISEKWVEACSNPDTMYAYEGYKNQWWQSNQIYFYKDSIEMETKIRSYKNKIIKKGSLLSKTGTKRYYATIVSGSYHAQGLLNQYIEIIPQTRMIIVHFGNNMNPSNPNKPGFENKLRALLQQN